MQTRKQQLKQKDSEPLSWGYDPEECPRRNVPPSWIWMQFGGRFLRHPIDNGAARLCACRPNTGLGKSFPGGACLQWAGQCTTKHFSGELLQRVLLTFILGKLQEAPMGPCPHALLSHTHARKRAHTHVYHAQANPPCRQCVMHCRTGQPKRCSWRFGGPFGRRSGVSIYIECFECVTE
jgi:hypothetical protein